MNVVVDRRPGCSLKLNKDMHNGDNYADYDDDDNKTCDTDRTNNGTQTKISKAGAIKTIPLKKIIIPNMKPKKRKIKIMNWKKYHRLSVIYAFIDDLERDYPAICTVSVIGKSVEGRDIKAVSILKEYSSPGTKLKLQLRLIKGNNLLKVKGHKMLKISNSDASNSAVWLDASIHSREWISTAVVTYFADRLARSFQTLPTCLTNKDWYIVPVLNPDGYEYTHTHDRMWRKNRAWYGGECGVDLNRNFSCGWGNNGDEGSSEEPSHVFYRGPTPFSEPETAAVRDTILGSVTNFKVFLSFHSYFELIIFPWGHKSEPCPDYLHLLEGGTTMARAIYETTGITYKVGSTKDLTYFACGTSTDWSYGIAKIPYSYMVELRSRKYKFRLPKDQIVENCVEIWNGISSLMDYVDKH